MIHLLTPGEARAPGWEPLAGLDTEERKGYATATFVLFLSVPACVFVAHVPKNRQPPRSQAWASGREVKSVSAGRVCESFTSVSFFQRCCLNSHVMKCVRAEVSSGDKWVYERLTTKKICARRRG